MLRIYGNALSVALLLMVFPYSVEAQDERRLTDSVNITTLARHIQALSAAGGHGSRVKFTPGGDSAAAYIARELRTTPGLATVKVDTFFLPARAPFNEKPLLNVVASLQGTTSPESIFVVGSTVWNSTWQTIAAPGADDNATGVAILLESARILANPSGGFQPRHTILFTAYGSEETNPADSAALSHGGSRFHSAALSASGARVSGMVSVDMVGYNPTWLFTSIITNTASRWLANIFDGSIARNSLGIYDSIAVNAGATYSDHDRFWAYSYPAVCLMEYAPPWVDGKYYRASPLYHTSSDSFGSVNMDLVRRVAQMTVASVARVTGDILTAIDGGALASGIPVSAWLSQNYPNPFNPATTVRYQLPSARDVRLTVYDLLGREVETLVNEMQAPGVHTVHFNAAGLSSGTYVYRLKAGSFSQSRSMILLR
jgi:hypothetical protein